MWFPNRSGANQHVVTKASRKLEILDLNRSGVVLSSENKGACPLHSYHPGPSLRTGN